MKKLLELLRRSKETKEKRDQLKAKLLEKRDSMSIDELSQESEILNSLNAEILTIENEIRAENEKVEADKTRSKIVDIPLQSFSDNAPVTAKTEKRSQEEIITSTEYRDAFYRSLGNNKIDKKDAEIMSHGKRVITDMNGGTVASGAGYLLPKTTLNRILQIIVQWGKVYARIEKFAFVGNLSIPIGTTGAVTSNIDGTVTLNVSFTDISIEQQAVVATIKVKNLLLKNSIGAFEAYLSGELAKYLGLQLENYILNGNPSSSTFTGIIYEIKDNSEDEEYSSVDWELINTIQGSLESPYGDNAIWIMKRSTFFKKFRSLTDAEGKPLSTETMGLVDAGNPGNPANMQYFIGGQQVIFSTLMPDTDSFVYGDLGTYVVNESQAVTMETSTEAGFDSDQTHWRGKVYSGGKPSLPTANTFKYYKYVPAS